MQKYLIEKFCTGLKKCFEHSLQPEASSHKCKANFIYTSFKFNARKLIAPWHCLYNSATPASLLRYGLRHRSNSGFAGTEPAEAPYAKTGIITHDGEYNVKSLKPFIELCFSLNTYCLLCCCHLF